VGVISLGYIGIETSQVDAWLSFAPDVLGLEIGTPGDDGEIPLRMDERPARLVLHPGPSERVAYIGWEVDDETSIDGLADRLDAAGASPRRGTPDDRDRRQVGALLHAKDPAGHAIELFAAPATASTTFASPREITGFRTGELGLGHIVLEVDAIAETVSFYTDVLGFRLSDRLAEALYFLRCNPRHHSIGLAHIGGPQRTLHIMLEMCSLDDVGSTLDICLERGIRMSTLGLHTNDRMTSFYLQTPSGFEIEYGWNGLLVDEGSWQSGTIDRPSVWGHHQLDPAHPPGPRAFRRLVK
jgi:2,3-dihydroxybiphenyl 1,2-dioxygenase